MHLFWAFLRVLGPGSPSNSSSPRLASSLHLSTFSTPAIFLHNYFVNVSTFPPHLHTGVFVSPTSKFLPWASRFGLALPGISCLRLSFLHRFSSYILARRHECFCHSIIEHSKFQAPFPKPLNHAISLLLPSIAKAPIVFVEVDPLVFLFLWMRFASVAKIKFLVLIQSFYELPRLS